MITSQQFSRSLIEPGQTDPRSLELASELVARYPYCQSGQILLACSFFAGDHPDYTIQLKKAAAYAGDRRIMKGLIENIKKDRSFKPEPEEIPSQPAPVEPEGFIDESHHAAELPVIINFEPSYEPLTQEELLAIVKKRLAEINAEKKREHEFSGPQTAEPSVAIKTPDDSQPETPVTKESLIDRFIREEPRISKPKAIFFNPTDSAIRSNFDEEEIVSETLAQLYAQQGNIQKAKHIYEKLSLINQEKSRYFAAQIEKLNS